MCWDMGGVMNLTAIPITRASVPVLEVDTLLCMQVCISSSVIAFAGHTHTHTHNYHCVPFRCLPGNLTVNSFIAEGRFLTEATSDFFWEEMGRNKFDASSFPSQHRICCDG